MPLDKNEGREQRLQAADAATSLPKPEGPVSIFVYSLVIIIALTLLAMIWGAGARLIYETFTWSWNLFGF